ncbi:zinc finger, CCHC-type containing protein [Tanacetum coccineum]
MNMNKAIQVSCIIDKLPPSWKDFKHTLKHKKEELTLVELGSHMCIEESPARLQIMTSQRGNKSAGSIRCQYCKKPGHLKKDYKGGKVGNKANGIGTNGSVDGSTNSLKAFVVSRLNDSIIWHARLGHVHFKRMQDMSKDGLIPAFDMDTESSTTWHATKKLLTISPKFKGVDFRIWQKKIHFLLSSMSVVYVLTTLIPKDGENATMEQIRKMNKWDNDDYVCRGLILNGMFDPLFDIYQNIKSSKELWDSSEAKYMVEDASNLHNTNGHMDKVFKFSCIIDQLPPSWKYFKHTLKHQKKELTLIELGSNICIEETLRVQDNDKPKGNNVAGPSIVNMMEHNSSFRYNDNKGKRKNHDTKADLNKKSKVTCWKCQKLGTLKKDYKWKSWQ